MQVQAFQNPFTLFAEWLQNAENTEPNDPNAMALATIDEDGTVSLRMVLLKNAGPEGFTFFTNTLSRKGRALAANPNVALCFHWKSLLRQVRVEGLAHPVSDAEADAYFQSRHPVSRLGAIASRQSAPLENRDTLVDAVKALESEYAGHEDDIPRPAHWSGYRVVPKSIEFWQQGDYRLHDRFVFTRDEGQPGGWHVQRLYP